VVEIDGVALEGRSAADVRRMMLGALGSELRLTVAPAASPGTRATVQLARARLEPAARRRLAEASPRAAAGSPAAPAAPEQVGIGVRLTNDPPFSVVSLVPGGGASLSNEIQAHDIVVEIDGTDLAHRTIQASRAAPAPTSGGPALRRRAAAFVRRRCAG
jgi:C-terminal processing protease CtpA/Prc